MHSIKLAASLGAALAIALTAPVLAAPAPSIGKDPAVTVAGAYRLDPRHQSVVARIGHAGGVSLSTFRFNATAGTLNWQPANVEQSSVEVTVDMTSTQSPVEGFGAELAGEMFLNAGQFPEAKFVSTSVRRTGPTTGVVMGDLTFRGQTKPFTFNAEFFGGGRNAQGVPLVGFTGSGTFKRSDFGFTAMLPGIGDDVELIVDLEFRQPPAAA
jgi:polyisoprenoid-binding protein YceI